MYVILEYMPKGDLKTLLRDSRTTNDGTDDKTYDNLAGGSKSLTPVQLMQFARDVANGMAFLAAQKVNHKKRFNPYKISQLDAFCHRPYCTVTLN